MYQVISLTGKILYVSPSSLETVGYAPEELIGRNIAEFIHIDDVDTFIRDLHASLDEKEFRLFYRRFYEYIADELKRTDARLLRIEPVAPH